MPCMADRPVNSRTLGRVVAVSLGLVFLGIIGLVVVSRGATGSRTAPVVPAPSKDAAPQDIAATGLSPVGKARFQYVDKADPGKVLGLIEWAKIDPQPLGRSIVDRPKATVFLSPSARMVITADRGTLIARPPSLEPESGLFEGNVTARYFIVPPTTAGTPGPLLNGAVPAVEFSTALIAFDLPLGEITSAGGFTLTGSGIDAAGSGVRIVANQVQGRIELFKVDKTTKLVLSPSKLRTLADSLQASARTPAFDAPATASGASAPTAALPAKQTLYRLLMGPDLSIRSAAIDLTAQRLEAFITSIDGKIAPDAIAPLNMFSSAAKPPRSEDALTPILTPAATTTRSPRSLPPFLLASDAIPSDSITAADDIHVSFSGPLDVRPITAMPTELRGQLAGLRIFGDRPAAALTIKPALQPQPPTATVTFADAWYRATTPRLALARGAEPLRAIIRQGQHAVVQCEKLTADLVSGGILLMGPGLAATDSEPNRGNDQLLVGPPLMRALSWSDQLDIGMLVADGRVSQQILMAIAQGEIRITDRLGTVGSGVVKLDFKEITRQAGAAPATAPATALARITLTEQAKLAAANPDDGTLSGDAITIDLAPAIFAAKQSALEIRQVRTVGSQAEPATATRRGLKLQAGLIDAKLQNDELGKTALRAVHAENNVSFTHDRDTFAKADRLDVASAESQVIDLSGSAVSIGRGSKERGGIEISGTQMRLDGLRRELYVHGPGRLLAFPKPAINSNDTAGGIALETVWTEFLRFDDDKGDAEARGSIVAVARRGTAEADTMRAEALKLTFEPRLGQSAAAQGNPPATTSSAPVTQQFGSERKMVLIEAIGRSVNQTGAPKATVEIRRLVPSETGADGPLEQLLFLEGDRILASPSKGTLEVPGPGQLLVDDHRQSRTTPAASTLNLSAPAPGTDTLFNPSRAGTSLFTWTGSLMFNQAQGLMQMRDGIRLLQRARETDAPVSLTSELIEARLRPLATTGTAPASTGSDAALAQQLGGELISAAAAINVEVVTPDGKRLNAGRVQFDAAQQIIAAYGDTTANLAPQPATADPARVTFVEPTKPSPLVARALRWFVKTGRIEIIEPMPVSGSR